MHLLIYVLINAMHTNDQSTHPKSDSNEYYAITILLVSCIFNSLSINFNYPYYFNLKYLRIIDILWYD